MVPCLLTIDWPLNASSPLSASAELLVCSLLPVLNLLTGQKSGFSPRRGCTDWGQTLQDWRAPGSGWLCKMSPQSPQGVGMRPQKYQKFPLFGKESPRRGDSLDRFPKFLGAFIRFYSVSNFMWFTSQVTELLLRNSASVVYPKFCAPCRKNYAFDRKMISTFIMVSTSSYHRAKLEGRSNNALRL